MYIVFVGKIKYICCTEFVCSGYKNNILKYFTTQYVMSVVSVTLNKKVIMMNGEEVFSIEHIRVQLVLINVYSCDGVCVCHLKTK